MFQRVSRWSCKQFLVIKQTEKERLKGSQILLLIWRVYGGSGKTHKTSDKVIKEQSPSTGKEEKRRREKWRQLSRAHSHGLRNSTVSHRNLLLGWFALTEMVSDLLIFVCFRFDFSRPKQVKDVAHQEEVVRVLTNTLETANVIWWKLFAICYDREKTPNFCTLGFGCENPRCRIWVSISGFFFCVFVSVHTCSFMGRRAPGKPLRHLPSPTSYLGNHLILFESWISDF